MISAVVSKFLIWLFLIFVRACYLPIDFIRLFYRQKYCPPISDHLLHLTAKDLSEKIRNREISSESVVLAYINRVREVNPILNAVIEDRFEQALDESRRVSEIVDGPLSVKELAERYPLLGVPISVKGSLGVEGLNHSCGVVLRNRRASRDARSVARVRDAGAIPILVSNTPEFCLNWETTNKLVGTTNNPYDTRRTVGGSSGGEAALISSAASLFGIGSDIAGSLRIPMHYCGIWGHKPTPRLISVEGHYPGCAREEWPEVFNVGPIARYAADLEMLFGVLVEEEAKTKLTSPPALGKIKVFYVEQLNSILTSGVNSSTSDALEEVVRHFDNICENKCVQLNLEDLNDASALSYLRLLDVDDIENLFEGKGEGSHLELLKYLTCLSKSVFTTIGYGVLRWWYQKLPSWVKRGVFKKIDNIRESLVYTLGKDGVLIMPTLPSEALPHGSMLKQLFDYGYCSIVNALGFPSTVCPILRNENGLPIGVQVIGAPHSDLLCLQVAKEIETAFGGWKPPPSLAAGNNAECSKI